MTPSGPSTAGRAQTARVVVVGAGIAGLAAALRVAEAQEAQARMLIEVTVCEAGARAGGVIATERVDDYLIERGPDAFLTEKPEALSLCERLGIAGRLVGTRPGARRTYVVHRGRLVALPDGFRLIAPIKIGPWLRSPLFSWPGKLRMAMDYVLPRGADRPDESVASFVTRRLGREAFERVAQPMIGGIYTADAGTLSLAATMPRLREMERRDGSLIRGFRRAAARAAAAGTHAGAREGEPIAAEESGPRWSLFAAPRDGMQALVDAAVAGLPPGALRLRSAVASVTRAPGRSGYLVGLDDGRRLDADAVIVATPAPAAARLLAGLGDGRLTSRLGEVSYASSAVVTLAYRRSEIRHPLDGSGFVVPRIEHRPILAGSFTSVKFPARAPEDRVLLRVFLGGALERGMLDRDDRSLIEIAQGEMAALLGAGAAPHLARVTRHRAAMPQYLVGHLARVEEIDAGLAVHPGLAVAGAAYRGIGIPDCIRSGQAAAERVLSAILASRAEDRERREVRPRPG